MLSYQVNLRELHLVAPMIQIRHYSVPEALFFRAPCVSWQHPLRVDQHVNLPRWFPAAPGLASFPEVNGLFPPLVTRNRLQNENPGNRWAQGTSTDMVSAYGRCWVTACCWRASPSVFFRAGTRRVRSDTRPSPNSTTGARRWPRRPLSWPRMAGWLSNAALCAGDHLRLWRHEPAVLPPPRQVGQWRGRGGRVINSALSGDLEHVCDAFWLLDRTLRTRCRGSWWETNVTKN